MGEVLGYVTRASGAPFSGIFGSTPSGVPARSFNSFTATRKDGSVVGTDFATVDEAQRALQNAVGSDFLNWVRSPRDSPARVERWEGQDPHFYPGDLRGMLHGGGWWRGDQGVRKVRSGGNVIVPRWSSFDGVGNVAALNAVAATTPTFDDDAANGRQTLVFDDVALQLLPTNLIGVIAPPFTAFILGRYVSAGRKQIALQSDANFEIAVSAAGNWEVTSGGTTLNLGAPANRLQLVSAIVEATPQTTVFLDGTASAPFADAPVAVGDWEISDAADAWHRDLPEVLLIPYAINTNVHAQLVAYFERRYRYLL